MWARPAPKKTPMASSRVIEALLQRMPDVKFIKTDRKMKQNVDDLLENSGIVHRTKTDKNDTNLLAVID